MAKTQKKFQFAVSVRWFEESKTVKIGTADSFYKVEALIKTDFINRIIANVEGFKINEAERREIAKLDHGTWELYPEDELLAPHYRIRVIKVK